MKREINSLEMICEYHRDGCFWEGKFAEYESHLKICEFSASHEKKCPLAPFSCSVQHSMVQSDLDNHVKENAVEHLSIIASRLQLFEEVINSPKLLATKRVDADGGYHTMADSEVLAVNAFDSVDFVESDGVVHENEKLRGAPRSLPQYGKPTAVVEDPFSAFQSRDIRRMLTSEIDSVRNSVFASMNEKLQTKDEEIASLRTQVTKLEKQIRSKSAELEDRDFRLSLIENSNHDGSMIWKIPQFSQRKADAENGKYTSIFSLPFYSGRYGYKMCLRLYIMGDGIGKGTHLSLFFVVMRGEFDNILQWPFTHKVTFKLINQAGGRDIVDTFQPDPMSSSFRKPKSDMNIASGCPRFVSHTELERGGFIVDDTIFIKSMIDVATIRHP